MLYIIYLLSTTPALLCLPELDGLPLPGRVVAGLPDYPGGLPHPQPGLPGPDTVVGGDEVAGVATNIIPGHPGY